MGVCLDKFKKVKKDTKLACSLKTDVFPADENGALLLGGARIADRSVPGMHLWAHHISMECVLTIFNKATFWLDALAAIVKSSCKEALYQDAPGTEPDCSKYKYYFDLKTTQEFMGKSYQVDTRTANSCWYVLLEEGITPELLLELNPSLDSGLARCALKPGLRYCLKKRSKLTRWSSAEDGWLLIAPILRTLFRWGWNIYSFVNFCRGVLRVFGWAWVGRRSF